MYNAILLLYNHSLRSDASTIMEHVNAFERYSKFKVWKINTETGFPKGLRGLKFTVVVLHYSLFGTGKYCLGPAFLEYLGECESSYKIAFFQDEYHYCQQRFRFIDSYAIDCIYTLLETDYFEEVYKKYTRVPKVIYTIPGYVGDDLLKASATYSKIDEERTIDIGYRGRRLPFYMGGGAQEKSEIADLFVSRLQRSDMTIDIETREEKRLYGNDWHQFLGNCRAVLGVEAGVSIFDIEDVVRTRCEALLSARPGISFAEVYRELLEPWEGRIYYRTVSPRVFEAAAFRCCQILYEGKYSGIIKPMIHYIPLKKDFSNFDEVIQFFKDRELRREMVEETYKSLIASGRYTYRVFIKNFDNELIGMGMKPAISEGDIDRVNRTLNRDVLRRTVYTKIKRLRTVQFPGRKELVKLYRNFVT